MRDNLIRFQLRTREDFESVRVGLGRVMRSLETSNSQYDCGEIELVLAEVLNNVAEHGRDLSLKHPISIRWQEADALCVSVIDSGGEIPIGTITKAKMPCIETNPADLPEGGFGWALVDIICSEVHSRRRGSFNTLRLYFSKK